MKALQQMAGLSVLRCGGLCVKRRACWSQLQRPTSVVPCSASGRVLGSASTFSAAGTGKKRSVRCPCCLRRLVLDKELHLIASSSVICAHVGAEFSQPLRHARRNEACAVEGPATDGAVDEESDCSSCGDDVVAGGLGLMVESSDQFVVVNFYHLVEVEDPFCEVARHAAFVQSREIRGRIYINHQGINAQFSGPAEDALAYAHWVNEDARFAGMYVQMSPSPRGHAFPRLKLRYKPSLVQVEGGTEGLPLTNAAARAVSLTPKEWQEKLDRAVPSSAQDGSEPGDGRKVLLLDVRNGYEWDVGHFKGAVRPEVDCFKETDFGLSEAESVASDPLSGVDKDKVDIMMYCTGGIRCDVYSTMLRQKGFQNLFALKGGVARYLKEVGHSKWVGNLFVFDSRLSVPPGLYQKPATEEAFHDVKEESCAKCQRCGKSLPLKEVRHRNCANVKCNELFLSCTQCVAEHKGCCTSTCASSPNLRPVLEPLQAYGRWHLYRSCDQIPSPGSSRSGPSRRAMRRSVRRAKRQGADASEDATDSFVSRKG